MTGSTSNEIESPVAGTISGSQSPPAPIRFSWEGEGGLKLSGIDWRPEGTDTRRSNCPAVLCLPGLSRNTRDFDDIASFLQSRGHRIVALDYRGRGASDWDPEWHNYALPVEEKDIDSAIQSLDLSPFVLLGTSRGGLHAMAMGRRFGPEKMAGVIFNDVGPHLEMQAIFRIAMTLGHSMSFATFEDLASGLRNTLDAQFPDFESGDWLKLARQLGAERNGTVVKDYDPALALQFASLDDATPAPDLWPLYERLYDRPVLVLRGEHSDLLSAETALRMIKEHPDARLVTVPGQGHAPVLWEEDVQTAIAEFVETVWSKSRRT